MYNENEEIQVIGIDLGVNSVDWQTNYLLQTEITALNQKLELKNRYNELLRKYACLEELVEIYKNERDTYKNLAEVYITKYNSEKEINYDIYELGI